MHESNCPGELVVGEFFEDARQKTTIEWCKGCGVELSRVTDWK